MFGWCGKYLVVDLSKREITTKELDPQIAQEYLGCRGLGTKMIMDMMNPAADPLSEENMLIFATGVLTGVLGTSTGRYEVVAKSPLTEGLAGSNSGGFFGPELKYAGFDMVIFSGKADRPVYLWINDGNVELREADHLWGKTVFETTEMIKNETNREAKICCIGPAGENLVKIAAIMNDMHRAAGRSGVGAVMGSKNLKAVAVKGTGEIKVAQPEEYMKTVAETRKALVENGASGGDLTVFGTPCLVNVISQSGALPVKNHGPESGTWEYANDISGETLKEKYLVRNKGCFSCTIACGRVSRIKEGPFSTFGEGPEYETIWAFGAECGVKDLAAVTKAAVLCNEYGIDTISMGATIACAMELYENGSIKEEEVPLPLTFGSGEAIVKMVEETAFKRGLGSKLSEGSYRLAESYGQSELSMTVKKQEMAGYDPRGAQGVGLGYVTSNRGACHLRAPFSDFELVMHTMDPNATEGKAESCVSFQDFIGFIDSAGMCAFPTAVVDENIMAKMLTQVTGIDFSPEYLITAGEKLWNLERLFNLKAGWKKEDDTLPPRLLHTALKTGPSAGQVNRIEEMLTEYYQIRGWDENGVPTKEKLQDLGLDQFAG